MDHLDEIAAAKTRLALTEQLNAAIANLGPARARLHKAKAELGTAEAELRGRQSEVDGISARLAKLLPTLPVVERVVERVAVVEAST